MKTGDLVETKDGDIGELVYISWQTVWIFGRSHPEAVMMVKFPDGYIRSFTSTQIKPYNRTEEDTDAESNE